MSVETDLDVEATYYQSEDGKHGVFAFGLPNAAVTVRIERTPEGATDGALLVENLAQLWGNALRLMIDIGESDVQSGD